ncbi:MAG TPA: hypothetical protein VGA95_09435 [Thermodesulfobacteriota bacterium]
MVVGDYGFPRSVTPISKDKGIHSQEELLKIREESQKQALPEQKRVFSVSEKIRRRVHNLPDPKRLPLWYHEQQAIDENSREI